MLMDRYRRPRDVVRDGLRASRFVVARSAVTV